MEKFPNKKDVKAYVEKSLRKTELERMAEGKKKTGAFTGLYAINNLNGREMPVILVILSWGILVQEMWLQCLFMIYAILISHRR